MRPGFVKLHRRLADHPLWLSEPFSRGQFWAHLLMIANYRDTTVRRGTRVLPVRRGQVFTSVQHLRTTVSRDRKTVRAWLLAFASDGMLDIETGHGADGGFTLLTIRNYERYQGRDAAPLDNGLPNGLPNETDDGLDNALDNGLDYGLDTSEEVKKKALRIGKKNKNARAREGVPPAFTSFWKSYPRKAGMEDALTVWLKGKTKAGTPIPPIDALLPALERAKASHAWTKDNGQFIPYPATWLNAGRWQDEPPANGHDPRRVNAAWATESPEVTA